jgi:adenylate kinase family enzyme
MKKILITGIPGMGKTTLGDKLKKRRGFEHVEMETDPNAGSEGEILEPTMVSFTNRPSRAGCMPEIGDVAFARMKETKKVILVDKSLEGSRPWR